MIFTYPFNKYGFINKIEMPIKYFFYRLEAFKGLEICPWDCVNIHEVVFSQFAYFCRTYPNYFLEQAICEENGEKYHVKHFGESLCKDSTVIDRVVKNYLRLSQIQEYVLHTRNLNRAKSEYISNAWMKSHRLYSELRTDEPEHCYEIKFEHYFYYNVQFWFEQGELMYEMKKVDTETKFNPLDIDDALDKLDTEYAKEILDLKGCIWN